MAKAGEGARDRVFKNARFLNTSRRRTLARAGGLIPMTTLPVTYGYARVSKSDDEAGNLETQLRLLADHGLLVSWGEFARPAEQEARAMHFNIRLWGSVQLLEAVLENYDLLSPDVRSSLPLKQFWALVQDEAV